MISLFKRSQRSDSHARAQRLASTLLNELTRLKISARLKGGELQRVHLDEPLLMTHDELWLPIDLQRLPLGITSAQLKDDAIVESLTDRLHAPVRVDSLPTGKLCYVVRMASGAAFPEVFPIGSFDLPQDAPPLAIPLGIDGQGEHKWVDFTTLPHLLGVGSTGNGKSNFVHVMLSTWIQRNTPEDLELWLADHKGGVELNRYKALMSTKKRPGIVRQFSYQPRDTIAFLQAGLAELERRLELLRKADCSDLERCS